jgi:hypothetical protein
MDAVSENESWIVERGALVIEKMVRAGETALSVWEQLVHCLWVADYMMRNAGDFANSVDLMPNFQTDAKRFALELMLPVTCEAFSLSSLDLEREYFDRFEAVCNEIRMAEPPVGHA